MRRRSILLFLLLALAVFGAACGSTPESLALADEDGGVESEISSSATAASETAEQVSQEPTVVEAGTADPDQPAENTDGDGADESTTTIAPEPDDTTAPTTETTLPANTCTAPTGTNRWVDVALDDPDGGLNLRTAPGTSADVMWAMPRNTMVVVDGDCQKIGSTNWWLVSPVVEADLEAGWASSRFLASGPVPDLSEPEPGLGKVVVDTDNAGLKAETLEGLAAALAEKYGFDDDVQITEVAEPDLLDAAGGIITYDLTGFKDDSVAGYRVKINFLFDRSADGEEFYGYETNIIDRQPICSRGVSVDGLCI